MLPRVVFTTIVSPSQKHVYEFLLLEVLKWDHHLFIPRQLFLLAQIEYFKPVCFVICRLYLLLRVKRFAKALGLRETQIKERRDIKDLAIVGSLDKRVAGSEEYILNVFVEEDYGILELEDVFVLRVQLEGVYS